MQTKHWLLAFAVALGLHAALATALMEGPTEDDTGDAAGAGNNGIEVGLGMLGSYAAMNQQITAKPEVESPPPAPEDPPVIEQTEILEPVEDKVAAEMTPPLVVPEQTAVVDGNSFKAPPQQQESDVDPRPTIEVVKARPDRAEFDSAAIRATGIANKRPVGGKVGNARTYISHLMGWLNKFKHYPKAAKKRKQQGTVKLQFTIDRYGQVLSYTISESSGHVLLDEAALQMLDAAAPLPAVPDDFFPNR